MKLNLKQPKYIFPLILLPFLCLFFYVWHSSSLKKDAKTKAQPAGIQDNVGEVSADVKKKSLSDKLDAFRNTYKETDGYTAVTTIGEEKSSNPALTSRYTSTEKRMLDSIDQAMKHKFNGTSATSPNTAIPYTGSVIKRPTGRLSAEDKALAAALSNLSGSHTGNSAYHATPPPPAREKDPMELFKAQMAYMDSVGKSNDPQYKAEQQQKAALKKAEEFRKSQPVLFVQKAEGTSSDFNTVMPEKKEVMISAIIDENLTAYAGSRIRLRLLDDIFAGHLLIKKGTYLYALISGFNGQRVTLNIQSILTANQILPVKLEVYDQDGLPGLYVPASAFRDFTKDLSGNTMQGVSLEGSSQNGSQLLMSTADKVFQSTSSAIAGAIRKNKAKIKYNSYIYLIDPQALQNAAQNH